MPQTLQDDDDHKPEGHRHPSLFSRVFLRITNFSRNIVNLLCRDIWDIEITGLPALKRGLLRMVRILILVWQGFKRDECILHASSLTFMTLLSFVPILALAVSLVRAVSYDESIREKTKELVRSLVIETTSKKPDVYTIDNKAFSGTNATPLRVVGLSSVGNPASPLSVVATNAPTVQTSAYVIPEGALTIEKLESMIDTGFDRVEQLNFGALGGIGLIFLIWAVISVLGDVEAAFNRVWGVVENRTLLRKFTDYLSVLIVCPLLFVVASSLPFVSAWEVRMDELDRGFFLSTVAGMPIIRVIWVLFLLTLAFTFLLRFTPNTKVRLSPGLMGGFVAAVGFAGWLKLCVALQVGVAKYSTFFGSFAMVPIVLSWVFVSWEILLFSAEVSYSVQNVDTYRMELGWREASQKGRILLAAALLREAVERLAKGDGLLNLREFNRHYRISVRLVRDVAHELAQSGIIVETAENSDCFAVRKNLSTLSTGDLVRTMLDVGLPPDSLGLAGLKTSKSLSDELEKVLKTGLTTSIENLPENPYKRT